MSNRLTVALGWLIAGTLVGGTLGSVGIAVAQTDDSTTTTAAPSSSSTAPAGGADKPTQRSDETPLTGADAEKAKAAALAAVPGATIGRVGTDADGDAYEVHLTRPDGTHATVKLDTNFNVVRVEEGRRGGKGCHHGGPRGPRRAEVTGEAADKAKAAALAAVPGATAQRVMEGRDGGYVVLLTKADGTRAAVKLDDSFTVTSVKDKVRRPGGRGHRHGPPPAEDGAAEDGAAEDGAAEDGAATPTNV